jgi:hypothetical protein
MMMFVFVRLSVFKNEVNTPGVLASPLRQGERTKVRGLGARMRDFPWREPSPSPSPCKGEATTSRSPVHPTQPREGTIKHDS